MLNEQVYCPICKSGNITVTSQFEKCKEYDILVAASYVYFLEIKQEALALGVQEDKIQYLNILSGKNNKVKQEDMDAIAAANKIGICGECGHGFRMNIPEKILSKYFDREYWVNDKKKAGSYLGKTQPRMESLDWCKSEDAR